MQHVTTLNDLHPAQPSCLTIGAFDGVHRGHQVLIGDMVKHAHATGRVAVVLTFYPHPSVVLRGRRPAFYISTPEEKADYLSTLGVDAVVTHPFNQEVANIPAADFVARLVAHARLSELWCGADFALGHNRQGDVSFLRAEGERRGFTVNVVEPVQIEGEVISSTRIRQALRDGAVEAVGRYLGRPFRLPGMVVEGAKRGQRLGIPTANLAIWEERALPAVGVYACRAHEAGGVHPAVANIGYRPTFDGSESKPIIEAHLLDFSGDLYGSTLTLEFIARLRPEMKFPGIEALVAQIRRDIAEARQILEKAVGTLRVQ
jgi:riboflavin kinase / FMN adenylyltransferase